MPRRTGGGGVTHTNARVGHRRLRWPAILTLLLAALFVGALLCPAALAEPAPDPNYIIRNEVVHQAFARTSYSVRVQMLRNDPRLLDSCLAPYRQNGLEFAYLEGRATWVAPDQFDIYLWPQGHSDMVTHLGSDDGYNLWVVSTEGFTPGATDSPSPAPSISPAPSASPSDAPSASPSAAVAPSDTPSATPVAASSATPSATPEGNPFGKPYRFHPLTNIWPFQLKKVPVGAELAFLGEEEVSHRACWKISRTSPELTMTLWVDKTRHAVVQLEYTDPTSGRPVRFNASDFFSVPPEAGQLNQIPLITFSQATVSGGMSPLFDVTALDAPTAIAPSPTASATANGPPNRTMQMAPPSVRLVSEPRLLSGFLVLVVSVLLVGLTWFGGKYLIFLLSRSVFSKELIVLDDAEGVFSRSLQDLGYSVTPASMELLTEERNFLGKKPGAVLPRAIVVAPHCIGLAKNFLFLIRAYVEEGGRVMLLDHGKADAPVLPFHAFFVPNNGEKISLEARPGIWKHLREEDVQTKTGHLLPKEYLVEVDHKRPNPPLIQTFSRATGVRTTVAGIFKAGKGEYLLCQMRIADDLKRSKLETSPITKLVLLDLISYLQGRTYEKEPKPKETNA